MASSARVTAQFRYEQEEGIQGMGAQDIDFEVTFDLDIVQNDLMNYDKNKRYIRMWHVWHVWSDISNQLKAQKLHVAFQLLQ